MMSLDLTQGIIRSLSRFRRKDATEEKCLRETILKTYEARQKGEIGVHWAVSGRERCEAL